MCCEQSVDCVGHPLLNVLPGAGVAERTGGRSDHLVLRCPNHRTHDADYADFDFLVTQMVDVSHGPVLQNAAGLELTLYGYDEELAPPSAGIH